MFVFIRTYTRIGKRGEGYLSMCIDVSKSLQVLRYEKHWLYALEVLRLFCSEVKNNLNKDIPKAAKDMQAPLQCKYKQRLSIAGFVFVFVFFVKHNAF